MTTTTAHEVETRKRPAHRPRKARSLEALVKSDLREVTVARGSKARAEAMGLTPDERARYRKDPAAFAREVIGVDPWARQVEILEAIRDHRDVAIRAGRKVGKSWILGVAALWFYMCFDDARVLLTAVTSRQVDGIIWREIRKLVRGARRPIDGELHGLARSGLKSEDLREIVGFTAREAEAVAGISGTNLLYIVDEASAVHDEIFEAIDGNRAAGGDARMVMISNPTKTMGRFFEAFEGERSEFYHPIHISSLESPNVVEGRIIHDSLASSEWVERMGGEWGKESPWFKVHVLGEFVRNEAGRLISLDLIDEAEARWFDAAEEGQLQIGVDPAGPSKGGDESAFAVRRGKKILEVYTRRGLTAEAHVAEVVGLIDKYRRSREGMPTVALDAEGVVGDEARRAFVAHLDDRKHSNDFELVVVRSSKPARNGIEQRPIDLVRDDLWLQLSRWLVDGAIPTDTKLERDLHCASWDTTTTSRRQKVIGKDRMRELLGGRSPDRADAVALAVWTRDLTVDEAADLRATARGGSSATRDVDAEDMRAIDLDPYTTTPIDPYGGGL